MIHCASCCEPYHSFCLNNSLLNINIDREKEDVFLEYDTNWRLSWTCMKCTPCYICNSSTKQKIGCLKCHRNYHLECFSKKWNTTKKPFVRNFNKSFSMVLMF